MTWREGRLGDFLRLKRGYDLPNRDRLAGAVPVVSSSGVTGYHNEPKVKGPGVVTGRYGTLGDVFYVKEDFWPLNTSLYVEDFCGNNARFVSYFLRTLRFAGQGTAAAVPGVNRNVLHELRVAFPDIESQNAIVDILQPYDDLIENNRRRIQLLEESARLLYREWFVHLRFPGHEHVKVVDGVPERWDLSSLSELTSYINRGIAPAYDEEGDSVVVNQRCIRNGQLSLENARRQSKTVKEEKWVRWGDILVNSTGTGTLGRVAQVWENLESITVDTHVTIVRPSRAEDALWLGFSLLRSESLFVSMAEGSTGQTELKRQKIMDFNVLIPPEGLRREFSEFAADIVRQMVALNAQNRKAAEARDLLLPRLMNGEIAV